MPPAHRLGQAPVGTTGVANRGKAAVQHSLEHARRLCRDERRRNQRQLVQVGGDRHGVNMGIDQARHEGAAGEIDRVAIRVANRNVADFADGVAFDQHVETFARPGCGGINQCGVAQQKKRHSAAAGEPPF